MRYANLLTAAFTLARIASTSAGVGKVIKSGNKVFNFFMEPQFTILSDGPGQPEFQVFAGFNIQVVN